LPNPALRCDFDVYSASEFNGFQPNSLRNGTGNLQTRIREFFSRNREFDRANERTANGVLCVIPRRPPLSAPPPEATELMRRSERSLCADFVVKVADGDGQDWQSRF
jgi:hypothetical protein